MKVFYLLLSTLALCRVRARSGRIAGPLEDDFIQWLQGSPKYANWTSTFVRNDLGVHGSYGGKRSSDETISRTPVVFVHGNCEEAVTTSLGWTDSIKYFTKQGYTSAELYATTWGPAKLSELSQQVHSCDYVNQIRQFFEAVFDYTKSTKINVVSHSMGVTISRKAIKGGVLKNVDGTTCNIGSPLTSRVETFIGIAGPNRGILSCLKYPESPACNKINGFYPGTCSSEACENNVDGLSEYLADLNSGARFEGNYVFTIWSTSDKVIGNKVYGYSTAQINGQDGEFVMTRMGHVALKNRLSDIQYEIIVNHGLA